MAVKLISSCYALPNIFASATTAKCCLVNISISPGYLRFVFAASVLKYHRRLSVESYRPDEHPGQALVMFLTQDEGSLMALRSQKHAVLHLCSLAHRTQPCDHPNRPLYKAEKSKGAIVRLHHLQLLLWSKAINISATGSFLHPSAGSCRTLIHKSNECSMRKGATDPYGLT